MWIEGRVFKTGKERGWVAEAEALDVITEGRSFKDAMSMLKEAIELLAEGDGRVLSVDIRHGGGETVYIGSNDTKAFFAFLLRRQRQIGGGTIQQAAASLGSRHKNAYAAYEQGKREPTLHSVAQLLAAANPEAEGTVAIHFGEGAPEGILRKSRKKAATRRHALA